MPEVLLLPGMYDNIRRFMGVRPGIDVPAPIGPLASGVADPAQPNPVNGRILAQIAVTLADFNLDAGTYFDEAAPRTYAITSTTSNGPYGVDFDEDQLIDIVRTAWLQDSSGSVYPLTSTSLQDLQRDQIGWQGASPGTPTHIYVIGYRYYLWPGPDMNFTLYANVGVSPTVPEDDTDTIPQLSADEIIGICVITARDLLAQELTDAVNKSRMAFLNPKAEEWKRKMLGSVAKRDESYVPGISLRTNRTRQYRIR